MVTKMSQGNADDKTQAQLAESVKESAQQIWLAGLGAFTKAHEEGSKAFETLVKEGLAIQRRTQAVAEEKITEAAHRVADMATDLGTRASGKWDRLETQFEDRVAHTLGRLGVPTRHDMAALMDRIEALQRSIDELSAQTAPGHAAAKHRVSSARKPRTAAKRSPGKPS